MRKSNDRTSNNETSNNENTLVTVMVTQQEKEMLDTFRKNNMSVKEVMNDISDAMGEAYRRWLNMFMKAKKDNELYSDTYEKIYLEKFDKYMNFKEDKEKMGVIHWWQKEDIKEENKEG